MLGSIFIIAGIVIGTCLIFWGIGLFINPLTTEELRHSNIKNKSYDGLERRGNIELGELKSTTLISIGGILNIVKHKLNPRQFEVFCAYMFKELGYDVELTPATNDGGVDIILNNGEIVVECKKYITQIVGREICQKLLGAKVQYNSDNAIILNTGRYNFNARQVENEVESLKLMNLSDIGTYLQSIGLEKSNYILQKTLKNIPIE